MNEILERIDDFLSQREPKEKYMIYASIFIIFIIIYYYFNYSILYKKLKKEKTSLSSTKQIYDLKSYEKKLTIKRNSYFNLVNEIKSSKNNLQKINMEIKNINKPKLVVTENDIFMFLKDLFNFSISRYLFPSYKIDENSSGLKLFTIKIKGRTDIKNFNSFISFLRFMENNNFIASFDEVEFNVSIYNNRKMSDYNASLGIWGYK